ncbi:MAG: preprotein translocase subunit SecE [Patescibacteria group bacterium]|nr:preprotein translocase subunit SecE [Patescibacteria group bacterium]MCL5432274.1 preprotein translocase subunit SecE [Patescibacteria group bacterium]
MANIGDNFTITRPDFGKNPVVFFQEVKAELSKVIWPKRPELIKLTAVVIGVSALVAAYLGGLDYIFSKGIELLLKK